MNRILAAAALAIALSTPFAAHAAPDAIELALDAAKHRPDFHSTHICPPSGRCQTVSTATRAPNARGVIGKDYFIQFDGNGKDQKIWCYQMVTGPATHTRVCQRGEQMQIQAYFPSERVWNAIQPGVPACRNLQTSKYDIDDAYADCVVNMMEKAAQSKTEANAAPAAKAPAPAPASATPAPAAPAATGSLAVAASSDQAEIERAARYAAAHSDDPRAYDATRAAQNPVRGARIAANDSRRDHVICTDGVKEILLMTRHLPKIEGNNAYDTGQLILERSNRIESIMNKLERLAMHNVDTVQRGRTPKLSCKEAVQDAKNAMQNEVLH